MVIGVSNTNIFNTINIKNNFYVNKNIKSINNNNKDNFSKGILKQIENIKKQIEKINENKGLSQEEKITQVKNLKEQMEELNKELVEKQLEEAKEERTKKTKLNDQNSNLNDSNNSNSEDMDIFLEANNTLHKIKNINKVKSNLKSSSRILKIEAKLDDQTDKFGNASKIINSKLSKASELEKNANNLERKIIKESSLNNKEFSKEKINRDKINRDKINRNKKDEIKKLLQTYINNLKQDVRSTDLLA